MEFLKREIEALEKRGLYRRLRTIEGSQGARVRIDGRELLLLGSNDYLGLANHPKVKEAATRAIEKYGFGAGASRLVSGSMAPHRELEERIAEFKGTEEALIFNSGYAANMGVIQAVAGRNDSIYSDRLNHASIVDGCLLSRADVKRYRHADTDDLERLLIEVESSAGSGGKKLIVTDGVFSMDGDMAPLEEIVSLAERYDAILMVDDAHGTGVLGEKGRGTSEHLGIDAGRIDIHMGTLGKALGAFGAYVAGERALIDFLINRARPFIYSTALPPSVAAAAIAALDIIEGEPERRERLRKNAGEMREGLESLGFDTLGCDTPIIPVLAGEAEKATAMMEALFDEGIFVQAIRPPTVPEGTARIRVTVTAIHSGKDIVQALELFERCGKKTGLI